MSADNSMKMSNEYDATASDGRISIISTLNNTAKNKMRNVFCWEYFSHHRALIIKIRNPAMTSNIKHAASVLFVNTTLSQFIQSENEIWTQG